MCGRFTLTVTPEGLKSLFLLDDISRLEPRYNIAPTQPVLTVRPSERSKRNEAVLVHWGLIPPWAKDPSIGNKLINARSETVTEKPAFTHVNSPRNDDPQCIERFTQADLDL
jgi:putative SOS response-associated peptidase YedK